MDQLLTVGQAAIFLGKSVQTLQRWDKNGKLKAHWLGTHRVYRMRDLQKFVDKSPKRVLTA